MVHGRRVDETVSRVAVAAAVGEGCDVAVQDRRQQMFDRVDRESRRRGVAMAVIAAVLMKPTIEMHMGPPSFRRRIERPGAFGQLTEVVEIAREGDPAGRVHQGVAGKPRE